MSLLKNVIVGAALFGFIAVGMTSCGLLDDHMPQANELGGEDFTWSEGECFEFVYPVELEVNGERVSVANAEELDKLCEEDTGEEEATFIYPLDILREGSDTPTTLENDDQMDEIFFDCFGFDCPDDNDDNDEDPVNQDS